jgi:hypothetical protein
MKARWLGCVALIGSLQPLLAQDWPDYKPVSFSQAWATATVAPPVGSVPSQSFEGAPQDHKFLVRATYTGRSRRIGPKRLEFIANWGKFSGAQDFAQHFRDEIEVRAEGMTVWLALQDLLVEPFGREAKVGVPVQLWIMYLGAAVQQDRVFVVNQFRVVK